MELRFKSDSGQPSPGVFLPCLTSAHPFHPSPLTSEQGQGARAGPWGVMVATGARVLVVLGVGEGQTPEV